MASSVDRRTFLTRSVAAIALTRGGMPRGDRITSLIQIPPVGSTTVIDTPEIRALAAQALDAARTAGATYADVRLTRIIEQTIRSRSISDLESVAIGVRAYIDGAWGFAASPYWHTDDAVRLAREATVQADANARAGAMDVELGQYPTVKGTWTTPVRFDPFVIPPEEKIDIMAKMTTLASQYRRSLGISTAASGMTTIFTREERALATSEGSFVTQILHTAEGALDFDLNTIQPELGFRTVRVNVDGLRRCGAGWELILDAGIPDQFPRLFAHAQTLLARPAKPGDANRYDVVLDAETMASVVARTLAPSTQLDRILGYEANAGGTSYFGTDPLALLGAYRVGSELLTLTANRSAARGLATVRWDEDGVEPDDFTLIRNGVLVDVQTTRDQAALLRSWYAKRGIPARSHGCAWSESALGVTMQHTPNLMLEPGAAGASFDDLVRDTKRGVAIFGGRVDPDFQGKHGTITGYMCEIVNGKLTARLEGLTAWFSTAELFRNLVALGGAATRAAFPMRASKGQPSQTAEYTVAAVPAKIAGLTLTTAR